MGKNIFCPDVNCMKLGLEVIAEGKSYTDVRSLLNNGIAKIITREDDLKCRLLSHRKGGVENLISITKEVRDTCGLSWKFLFHTNRNPKMLQVHWIKIEE